MLYARLSPAHWSLRGVIDIFAAAGLAKPDISVLSDEFPCRGAGYAPAQTSLSKLFTEAA